uniref:Peptidyl-prolyl cis-trans isomerase n=1 Tax=Glycine max TaxID=3847 RepID=A0A0R0I9Z1_SOYBN
MAFSLPPPPSLPHHFTRRSLLLLSTTTTTLSVPSTPPPTPISTPTTPTVTDRVFMDFSLCPNNFLPDRADSLSPLCSDTTLLGRVVLGLYGNLVPLTVSNFKSMCLGLNSTSSSYKNTLVHKVFPGQYFLAGRQGRPDKGEVRPPHDLPRNTDTVAAKAFALTHSRPGVVSLSLSENDDDDEIKLDPGYRNVEFLITTGPGPCPQLDNKNIVFGTVLEGLVLKELGR